jgi:hypothetical protein
MSKHLKTISIKPSRIQLNWSEGDRWPIKIQIIPNNSEHFLIDHHIRYHETEPDMNLGIDLSPKAAVQS